MKRIFFPLVLTFIFALLLAPVSKAEESNQDTLVNWGIQVRVPEGATAVLEGDEYYVYTQEVDSIPYGMLTLFDYRSAQEFLRDFTEYMAREYEDLQVTQEPFARTIGEKSCLETDYSYTISGYQTRDRRIALEHGGQVYMFCSKEIEELGMTVDTLLEDLVGNCRFLDEEGDESPTLAEAYLYCEEGGRPKYWLDLSEMQSSRAVLHCYFRSSDPTFYESRFYLDLNEGKAQEEVTVKRVLDSFGLDHSNWFQKLSFYLEGEDLVLEVIRDEATLAGGSENNILTGTYRMQPMGTGREAGEVFLSPLQEGPFSAQELGRLAQMEYFVRTGYYPPQVDATENPEGDITIHLYEVVEMEDFVHTATSAWYTVNTYGVGANDITGEPVCLTEFKRPLG